MPDPSPKSLRGDQLTSMVNELPDAESDDEPGIEPGDLAVSARLARGAGFVRACLALADWVGAGRPATARGLLRPAVAREAYRELDLWQWERRYDAATWASYGRADLTPDEDDAADAVRADAALHSWRSAGDCLPLDRLWYACEGAGLIDRRSSTVSRSDKTPRTDEEWRDLALALLLGLCLRLGWYVVEPLIGLLLIAVAADEEWVSLDEVRAWWDARCPEQLRDLEPTYWQNRLDLVLFHIEDCSLVELDGPSYRLTDLGRDFALVFVNAVDEGMFEP
jgi:hypothetical protein